MSKCRDLLLVVSNGMKLLQAYDSCSLLFQPTCKAHRTHNLSSRFSFRNNRWFISYVFTTLFALHTIQPSTPSYIETLSSHSICKIVSHIFITRTHLLCAPSTQQSLCNKLINILFDMRIVVNNICKLNKNNVFHNE